MHIYIYICLFPPVCGDRASAARAFRCDANSASHGHGVAVNSAFVRLAVTDSDR